MAKPKAGMKLHKFIATGGKPKDFPKNPALNSSTVPNLKKK
ncbi:MAG: hypothetical protein V4438_04190 [Patescibacteria group bacterium]